MLSTPEKLAILKTVSIFSGIPDETLPEIAAMLEEVDTPAGTTVIERGDIGTCMYIVAAGRLRVHDGVRTLDELNPGDAFGEMALLDAAPRSAFVSAVDDSRLLRLEQEPFYSLLAARSELAAGIIRMLSGRLRHRLRDVTSLYDRKDEVERELEIGRQIQAGFLPETLPQLPGWEIAAYFRPAREIAGDFYDVFPLAGGSIIGILIGDVSGKGVGSALFMALTRTLLRAYADQNFAPPADGSPAGPQSHANAVVRTVSATSNYVATVHGRAHMFATLFFGALDRSTGLLTYVSAGHDTPAISGPEGLKARIAPTGPAAGLLPGMPFASAHAQLDPGDTLLLYTDGVTDAHDPQGQLFGQERLFTLAASPHPTAAALLAAIVAALEAHVAASPRFDDVTLLALRRATS